MKTNAIFSNFLILVLSIFLAEASAQEKTNPVDYSFTTGMSTGFGANSPTLFNTWVSPRVGYQVNPKLHLDFGTTLATSNYQSLYTPFGEYRVKQPGNIMTTTVFVNGAYQVSDKLTVFGSGYKQMEIAGKKETVNPRALDFNSEGMNVGFEYRLNENMKFGAEIGISRGSPGTMYPYNPIFNRGSFNPYRLSTFP